MPEKVLLVCTSVPANVRRAIARFPQHQVFSNYELDLLCQGREFAEFQSWQNVRRVLVFPRRRECATAIRLWWKIVRERYSVVAVLWCLEPERWLANAFALLSMGRRILVFNENLDCAFLSPSFLLSFFRGRIQSGSLDRSFWGRILLAPLKHGSRGLLRLIVSPVRFLVLLILVAELFIRKDRRRGSEASRHGQS
jgi:hypothetical protein